MVQERWDVTAQTLKERTFILFFLGFVKGFMIKTDSGSKLGLPAGKAGMTITPPNLPLN